MVIEGYLISSKIEDGYLVIVYRLETKTGKRGKKITFVFSTEKTQFEPPKNFTGIIHDNHAEFLDKKFKPTHGTYTRDN